MDAASLERMLYEQSGLLGVSAISSDVRTLLASNDPRVHIGLGNETAVRDVTVKWPGGMRERFGDIAVDRVVVLRKNHM